MNSNTEAWLGFSAVAGIILAIWWWHHQNPEPTASYEIKGNACVYPARPGSGIATCEFHLVGCSKGYHPVGSKCVQ